jgi:hypothetical protein
MNKAPDQKENRRLRLPRWLGDEWVFQAIVAILVMPVAIQAMLSLGV